MAAKYRLMNIRLWGNEHGQLRRDTVYAELRLCADGGLEIASTLEYVLAAIRDRKLDVEGVTIEEKPTFRGPISVVSVRDAAPPVLTEEERGFVKAAREHDGIPHKGYCRCDIEMLLAIIDRLTGGEGGSRG